MKFEARYLKKSSESLRGECCAEEILEETKKTATGMDYSILFLVLFLVGFGLVILYSTSSYKASLLYNDTTYWVKKRHFLLLWESVACYLLLRETIISGRKNGGLAWVIYGGVIGLLLLTFAIGAASHGSQRWISIGHLVYSLLSLPKLESPFSGSLYQQ